MHSDEEKSQFNSMGTIQYPEIDIERVRYPLCIVWTPIPALTWIFPFIGHMGICTSAGIVRDFTGPYHVSEDNMGFGRPVKYWQLRPERIPGGIAAWDRAIADSVEIYKGRMHNLCCDNCHSMVALALNKMKYDNKDTWNMVNLAIFSFLFSNYISCGAWLKTWLPFLLWVSVVVIYIAMKL